MPTAAVAGDVDAGVLRAAGWQVAGRLAADAVRRPARRARLRRPRRAARGPPGRPGRPRRRRRPPRRVPAAAAPGRAARAAHRRRPRSTPTWSAPRGRARAGRGGRPGAALGALGADGRGRAAAGARPAGPGDRAGLAAGRGAAAELVDLVQSWCGDVVSVTAAPAALPARALPGGARVGWSLLTACGATVLVSADDAPPLARLSFPAARLEAGPLGARWVGGAELPLLPTAGPPAAAAAGAAGHARGPGRHGAGPAAGGRRAATSRRSSGPGRRTWGTCCRCGGCWRRCAESAARRRSRCAPAERPCHRGADTEALGSGRTAQARPRGEPQ